MLNRRALGKVVAVAGLTPRRPDQYERPDGVGTPALGAGFPSSRPVRRLAVGSTPNPQIIIDSTLNFTVAFLNFTTSAPPSNVASVANIQAAIRFPSNNPAEVSPPLIAETLITFTDASVADALLTLSGFNGIDDGAFELLMSARSLPSGGNSAAALTGTYAVAGTAITLIPMVEVGDGTGMVSWVPIRAADPTATTLLNFGDPWHNLGSTGLAGDAGTSQFRLTAENELQLSVHSNFNALGGTTTATFANALAAPYIPPAVRLTGGEPVSLVGGAAIAGTRLTVNGGTGVVSLVNLPAGTTAAGCDVRIPLT